MTAYNQSRIKSFRRCQKQYSFKYETKPGKELTPRTPSLPLKRGGWLHALQESYHRQLAGLDDSWQERQAELTEAFNGIFEEERAQYGDLPGECARLFKSYLRYSREQADSERYSVAALRDGGGPAVEFVIEIPLDKYGIDGSFKGRIDLLMEDHEYGGFWIWDSKWVRSLPTPDERMMSPQSLLYAWGLRELGYPIEGFVFNYGRTKPPTVPNVLKRGTLSQASRMDTDYATYLTAIKELHGEKWKLWASKVYYNKLKELQGRSGMWFRRERVPVEEDRVKRAVQEYLATVHQIERRESFLIKHPPRTYEYNCKFGCGYHNLCVAQFTGLDIKPMIRKHYTFEEERYGEDEVESSVAV